MGINTIIVLAIIGIIMFLLIKKNSQIFKSKIEL